MRARRGATIMLLAVAMVAAGCTTSKDEADRGASQQTAKAQVSLAALPALTAPADGSKQRGLVGDTWVVHLPVTDDPAQPDVGVAGGVKVRLVDGPGDPLTGTKTYRVYDALAADEVDPIYEGPSPDVPANTLRNGDLYQYEVSTSDGQARGPFAFRVGAAGAMGGAYAVQVQPETFVTGAGSMGIGLSFSTADVGTTKALAATAGLRTGLPPGWSWSGVGSGITKVVVEDALGFYDVKKIVEVHREGGDVVALGCTDEKGWGCTALASGSAGPGLQATLLDDAGAAVTITDPTSSQRWQVETWSAPAADDPDDVLSRREGRVTSMTAPGTGEVTYGYASKTGEDIQTATWKIGGDGSDPTWKVLRAGDAGCGGPTPKGFVATPSGAVCGWVLPSGDWYRLFHVEAADGEPQFGRAMRLPGSASGGCAPADGYDACQGVWDQVQVTDWSWSPQHHPMSMREASVAQATMAGAVDVGDASLTTEVAYDELGRADRLTSPAQVAGQARAIADHTYPAPEAGFPGATHQLTIAQTASDGSVPTLTSASAFDDGLRKVGERAVDGTRSIDVWHADRDIQLARIGADGTASVQSFDAYDRATATWEVPNSSIDQGRCRAGTTDVDACRPTGGWGEIAGNEKDYSPANLPKGLIAEWYADRSFSGVPLGRTAIDAVDPDSASFVLDPPDTDKLGDGGAVRISGALTPASAPTTLEVDLAGTSSGGWAFLNDEYLGGLGAGSSVLELDQGDRPLPYHLELLVTFDGAPPPGIGILDTSDGSETPLGLDDVRQRSGVVTEERAIEAHPAGSSTFKAVATRYAFDDPATVAATTSTMLGCGTAGSYDAAAAACASASAKLATVRTFERDGYGGTRPATETAANGDVTSYDYYGPSETPGGDVPAAIAGTPQHAMLKSVTHPDGRVVRVAYDAHGEAACRATGGAWSCTQRDGGRRVVRETFRSADGSAPAVVVTHDHQLGSGPSPLTVTTTRTDGDAPASTEVTTFTAGGRISSYTQKLDAPEGSGASSTTSYEYDPLDRLTAEQTTITAAGGTASFATGRTYDPGSGLLATVTVGDETAAAVTYSGGEQRAIQSVSYPSRGSKLSMAMGYDASRRPVAKTWTLSDGSTVEDRTTMTAGGRVLTHRLDGVDATYGYDEFGRLVSATTGDRTDQYGWDAGNHLVCTARSVDAGTPSCDDAKGKVTNTYEGGRLTATTDEAWALPSKAYDANGNLLGAGGRTFTYDARQQMSAIAAGEERITIRRDATGRAIARTTGDAETSVRYLYASPSDETAVAELSTTGAVRFRLGLPGGVLWSTDTVAIGDLQGTPSVLLEPDGTRIAGEPTRRYGPFGEDLSPPRAAEPEPEPTTTTTTEAATTTTTEATTTTTEAPDEATTTTTDAGAEATATTEAGEGGTSGAAEATTTEATGGDASTTTTTEAAASDETTTTTEAPASTTTTTEAAEASGLPPALSGWSDRLQLDDGIINLGQRAMLPALGTFTGPDPVPNGSCTVYGYTCSDPVNTQDLGGTWSLGATVVLIIGLVISFLMPPSAPALEVGLLGFLIDATTTAVANGVGQMMGLMLESLIDTGSLDSISQGDLLAAALAGAAAGAIGHVVGGLGTSATKWEGTELPQERADYAIGFKVARGKQAVNDKGLYGRPDMYRGWRTMGGPRCILQRWWAARGAGQSFLSAARRPLIARGLLIATVKQAFSTGTRVGMHEAEIDLGIGS